MRAEAGISTQKSLNHALLCIGYALLGLGAFLLFYMAVLVYTTMTSPEDVKIVQYVLDHVRQGDTAIYGHMTDVQTGRKMDFELNWSQSVRTISFMFLGIAVLGILSAILKVLIESGIRIIRLANRSEK